jgi:phage shock protein A
VSDTRRISFEWPRELVDRIVDRGPERRRALEERVDGLKGKMDELDARERRRKAEPVVDKAIERGALPSSARESTLRAFEVAFDETKFLVETRPGNAAQASANRQADPELERRFEATFEGMFGKKRRP